MEKKLLDGGSTTIAIKLQSEVSDSCIAYATIIDILRRGDATAWHTLPFFRFLEEAYKPYEVWFSPPATFLVISGKIRIIPCMFSGNSDSAGFFRKIECIAMNYLLRKDP